MEIEVFSSVQQSSKGVDYVPLLNNSEADPEIDGINKILSQHNNWILESTTVPEIKIKYLLKFLYPIIAKENSDEIFGYSINGSTDILTYVYDKPTKKLLLKSISRGEIFKIIGFTAEPKNAFYYMLFVNIYATSKSLKNLNNLNLLENWIEDYPMLKLIFNGSKENHIIFTDKETGDILVDELTNYCRDLLSLWQSINVIQYPVTNIAPKHPKTEYIVFNDEINKKTTELLNIPDVPIELLFCYMPDKIYKLQEYMKYYGIKDDTTESLIKSIRIQYNEILNNSIKKYNDFSYKLMHFNRNRISKDLYGKVYAKLTQVEQNQVNDKLKREETKNKIDLADNIKINKFYKGIKYNSLLLIKEGIEVASKYPEIVCKHSIEEAEMILSNQKINKISETISNQYGTINEDQVTVCKLCGELFKVATENTLDYLSGAMLGYKMNDNSNYTGIKSSIIGASSFIIRTFVKFKSTPNINRICIYIADTILEEINYIDFKLRQTKAPLLEIEDKIELYILVYIIAVIVSMILDNEGDIWFVELIKKGGFVKINPSGIKSSHTNLQSNLQATFSTGLNIIISMKHGIMRTLDIDKLKIADAIKKAYQWLRKYQGYNSNIIQKHKFEDLSFAEIYKQKVMVNKLHTEDKYSNESVKYVCEYEQAVKNNNYSSVMFDEKYAWLIKEDKHIVNMILTYNYRPKLGLTNLNETYLKSCLYFINSIEISLSQIICSVDGGKHKWGIGIFNKVGGLSKKRGGNSSTIEVIFNKQEILDNYKLMDFKCDKCNYSFLDLAKNNAEISKKIDLNDKLIKFYDLYSNRCPIENSHIFVDGSCTKCRIDLNIIKTKDIKFYDKYKQNYVKDVKQRLKLDISDDTNIKISYKNDIENQQKKVKSKYGEWKINNSTALELSRLAKVEYKHIANLGLSSGIYYEDFIKMEPIKEEDPNIIENRNIVLTGYALLLIHIIKNHNQQKVLDNIKKIFDNNKIKYLTISPDLDYNNLQEHLDYANMYYSGKIESSNIILNWICNNLINICKQNIGSKYYSIYLEIVSALIKILFVKEEFYSKYNRFKYFNIDYIPGVEGSISSEDSIDVSKSSESSESINLSYTSEDSSENAFENNFDMDSDNDNLEGND